MRLLTMVIEDDEVVSKHDEDVLTIVSQEALDGLISDIHLRLSPVRILGVMICDKDGGSMREINAPVGGSL